MQQGFGEELTNVLCEFLEACIHVGLFAKHVYPVEAFQRCRLYGQLIVHKCRHPDVERYISGAVDKAKPLLRRGAVREVALVFEAPEGQAPQRISILIEHFSAFVNPSALDVPALVSQLCGAVAKVQLLGSIANQLPPLDKGCNWEVVVSANSREGVDLTFWEEQPPPDIPPGSAPEAAEATEAAAATGAGTSLGAAPAEHDQAHPPLNPHAPPPPHQPHQGPRVVALPIKTVWVKGVVRLHVLLEDLVL